MATFSVYILLCNDGSFYTGHTDDLEKRMHEHQSGLYEGYTSSRLPVVLVFSATCSSRYDALAYEIKIKKWSRKKKEALIASDWKALSEAAKKNF